MSFDTKKMIIAVIIVGILFVLFLGYAFNSIQKVELDIREIDSEALDMELEAIADEIIDKFFVEYVDNISLDDINMNILLVNHQRKSACIIRNETIAAVDYNKLDKSIIYCNNFLVLADDVKTIVVNCDEILGNAAARAISSAYQYEYVSTSNLSPESVECFQTATQDETISFYRYAMIESAKDVYFNDGKLDNFYYFYDQWTYYEGMNQYQEVINYDYYDGFKAFVYLKVMEDIDTSFTIEAYIDSYKNEYGIYSKDKENAVMGMLWCLLMEKQSENIICNEDNIPDMYKMLLEGVPQGQAEEDDLRSQYHENFTQYIDFIDKTIKEHEDDVTTIDSVSPIITAEIYQGTIKVADNNYIYIDYIARDSDNKLLHQNYIMVEISPYTMQFFFE